MTDSKLDILAISGSLRRGSFNTALLRTAQAMAPDDVAIEICDYSDIPLYNGDVEAAAYPAPAARLKARIGKADALLFAVPEYNYSLPGVLKNVLDWGSRPSGQSAWAGKPVALLGTGGGLGTARAQYHFRQIATGLNMHVLNRPEIFVANASQKFDKDGNLTDDTARGLIGQLITGLRDWTRRLAAGA
ncbi:NADPH-dependent FMN reductase [Limobrevibacterium gyesilva]|uniref:NAD(P)H-dependent oxidoreductase n=1 Tax=Limobrevibacterium gyesilva TaxID=2991712 RepID=A0AA41YRI1_9PROT|nr:NADPH-dependent FMN reductase [Limobrevibacterium gyesilva]MCW3475180.1 NAD(P)H-dependent oxidoreductase [Limobrevibacterium gyesilva]